MEFYANHFFLIIGHDINLLFNFFVVEIVLSTLEVRVDNIPLNVVPVTLKDRRPVAPVHNSVTNARTIGFPPSGWWKAGYAAWLRMASESDLSKQSESGHVTNMVPSLRRMACVLSQYPLNVATDRGSIVRA